MHATSTKLRRLTKRAQFLRAASGKRANRRGLGLHVTDTADDLPGVGYTVTKKAGNAPQRNRIKRRLRAATKACAASFQPRHDYVLLGRSEALDESFTGLVRSLESLLARVHANREQPKRTE